MLFFDEKGDFAFVKVAQKSLTSGISASAIGCLSVLELIRTNPKHSFNMEYIEHTLNPYSHSGKALEELEKNGYLTKHCYPTGSVNAFSWKVEVDSFHQNTGNFGVIYYDAERIPTKGCNLRHVRIAEESASFLRIPKDLVLNKKIGLSGKGLYALLLNLPKKDYSKEEIRKALFMNAYAFNKAWRELTNEGYLKVERSSDRKYDFLLCPLPIEKEGYAKCGHKKEIFKIDGTIYLSNIREEKACVQSLSDLADAVIASKPLDQGISKVLFDNHSNDRINRFNEELTGFLKNTITEYMDYKTLLEKYRDACRILSVKDDIKSLGGYIHTILNKSFAPEKKRVCFDYSKNTKEGLLSEWEEKTRKKNTWEGNYQTFQKSQYDFNALNAFILSN